MMGSAEHAHKQTNHVKKPIPTNTSIRANSSLRILGGSRCASFVPNGAKTILVNAMPITAGTR